MNVKESARQKKYLTKQIKRLKWATILVLTMMSEVDSININEKPFIQKELFKLGEGTNPIVKWERKSSSNLVLIGYQLGSTGVVHCVNVKNKKKSSFSFVGQLQSIGFSYYESESTYAFYSFTRGSENHGEFQIYDRSTNKFDYRAKLPDGDFFSVPSLNSPIKGSLDLGLLRIIT